MLGNWDRTCVIVKETFAMAGKHKALYIPPILNLMVSILLVLVGITLFVIGDGPLFIVIGALLLLLSYFVSALLSAALSWMVFETVLGKRPHFGKAMTRAYAKGGSLMLYALISQVVSIIAGQLRNHGSKGLLGAAVRGIFACVVEEAWDIASHLLLPAIVLTNHDFKSAVKELPTLVKHVPELLVGGFAFDVVVGWLYVIEFVIAVLFFLMFAGISTVFAFFFALTFFCVLGIGTYIFYSFTKSVYFTLLYLELHPEMKKR